MRGMPGQTVSSFHLRFLDQRAEKKFKVGFGLFPPGTAVDFLQLQKLMAKIYRFFSALGTTQMGR
jgi:hypothetical protein